MIQELFNLLFLILGVILATALICLVSLLSVYGLRALHARLNPPPLSGDRLRDSSGQFLVVPLRNLSAPARRAAKALVEHCRYDYPRPPVVSLRDLQGKYIPKK